MKSKLSKALVLLLTVAMLATQLMVPAYAVVSTVCLCGKEQSPVASELMYSTPADCTTQASETYLCKDCGGIYVVFTAPANGHTADAPVKENIVEATCANPGSYDSVEYCSVCGEELSRTEVEVPQLAHVELPAVTENYVDATCDAAGSYDEVVYCDVCGEEVSRKTIPVPALNHTEGEPVIENNVDATCEAAGGYDTVIYCTVCNAEVSREHTDVAQLAHDWVKIAAQSKTCLVDGVRTHYKCNLCGEIDRDLSTPQFETNIINPAKGHTWDAGVVTPPTCETDGYTTYTCTNSFCDVPGGDKKVENVVPALGHTEAAAVEENRVEPDCDTDGSVEMVVYCSVCGVEISRDTVVLPATGHNYVETGRVTGDGVNGPWCTDSTVISYECTKCFDTKQETLPGTMHDYDKVIKGATCSNPEEVTYTCKVCAYSFVDTTGEALPHTELPPVEENRVEPDCTNDGSYDTVVYCEVCGDELSRVTTVLPALGHTEAAPVEENRVEADCVNDGSYDTVVYCSVCGDELSRVTTVLPALGHTPVVDEAVDSDCENTGLTEGSHCDVCGEVLVAQEVVPALGHEITTTVTAPTCSDEGFSEDTCSRCDYYLKHTPTEINPLAHKIDILKDAVAATCVDTGLTHEIGCQYCGMVVVPQQVTAIDGTNHDMVATVTDPTCTEDGYTTHTCARGCGLEPVVDTPVSALGHTEAAPVEENRVEADCVNDGSYDTVVYCEVCGEELSRITTVLPALGHTEAAPVEENRVEADCVNDGSYDTVVYCDVCDEELSRETTVLPALGHRNENVIAKDATCTEDGWSAYIECARCGETSPHAYYPAFGHDYVSVVTEPTCTAQGYTTHTCNNCGDVVVDSYVPPIDHPTTETIGKVDPTCTEDGYIIEKCTVCGETFRDYDAGVPSPGHQIEVIPAKEATCTEIGWAQYELCTVCGETNYSEIPALGHDMVHVEAKAPTCTEIGWEAYDYCTRGDINTYVELPALGHTEAAPVEENRVEPDCTSDGSVDKVVYCSVCNAEVSRVNEVIPALGHTEGEVVVENEVEPDCVNNGSYDNAKYCTVCGEELDRDTNVVPALGHTELPAVEENYKAPDCVNTGSVDKVVYCSVCGEEVSRVTETIPALGHTELPAVEENYKAPDCVNTGSVDKVVYCDVCDAEVSRVTETIPALGHKAGSVQVENNVDPDCVNDGSYDNVVYCTVCNEELSRDTVTVPALGHKAGEVVVENEVPATFDAAGGRDDVVYCTVCNEELSRNFVEYPILNEEISFTYKASGINGTNVAVNSGYITLDVYMNVNTDIARLHGINFALSFNEHLTLESVVSGSAFQVKNFTPLDIANAENKVSLAQNAGIAPDVEFAKGEIFFATLTFKVDADFYDQDVEFAFVADSGKATHKGYNNTLTVNYDASAAINVTMLGDANDDGSIDSDDIKEFVDWYLNADIDEYNAIFDMDKNGIIDGDDYSYINAATVGDNGYLGL